MLRSGIFSCTCTHTHVMLRSGIFFCTCTHTSCYALGSSLAIAHTHTSCYDLGSSFALAHTHIMLRSGIFSCTCTRTHVICDSCLSQWNIDDIIDTCMQYMKSPLLMSKFNVPNHTRNAMKNIFCVIPKLVSDVVIFNTEMNEWYVNNESMMICQKNNMNMLVNYCFTTICKTLDPSSTKTSCSWQQKTRGFLWTCSLKEPSLMWLVLLSPSLCWYPQKCEWNLLLNLEVGDRRPSKNDDLPGPVYGFRTNNHE